MDKINQAVNSALLFDPDLLTGDSINALAGGNGMLNVTAFCSANAIAQEILRGADIKVKASNEPKIPLDDVLAKGIDAAKRTGADAANAALINAVLCYVAGSNSRAGVPSGNRKLGAMARMIAGVPKGSIATIPTPKSNNKISGFPAVAKIYEAMMAGQLTSVDGRAVPKGVSGTPLVGHSVLGEDIIFPELGRNAAMIGTKAMMDAYAGAGLTPNKFISAALGAAATLEIVHPDAVMPDSAGPSFKVFTPELVGAAAAEAAGLPATIHFRVTGEEFSTAKVIGDMGIILKDSGTPTVVGMMAFYELLGCFAESGAIGTGSSGGPRTAPIGHALADAAIALRIIAQTGSVIEAAKVVRTNKATWLDPEFAAFQINTVARKVECLIPGPVSKAVVLGTQEVVKQAIADRVKFSYEGLKAGRTVGEIVADLEQGRIRRVEEHGSAWLSNMYNHDIKVQLTKITGGARREGKLGRKYLVMDADVDEILTVDGKQTVITGLLHKYIPEAIQTKNEEMCALLPYACPLAGEMLVTGHTLVDVEIPVMVAALLGAEDMDAVAADAVKFGPITCGIPGVGERALQVAALAKEFYQYFA